MQLKSAANLPIMQIVFGYDHMGRRIMKRMQTTLLAAQHYDNGATQLAWSTSYDHRYLYQGPAEWLLGATMVVDEYSNLYDQQLFAWGVDLSGSEQGAGGIGGLIMFQDTDGGGPMVPVYDTNGNLTHLFDRDGLEQAEYQYGPFGEVRGQSRSAAAKNPFRFSTKFTDNETGLVYYGYRYYSASLGRWISRDPIEEGDGPNVMAFVRNGPVGAVDALGLKRLVVAFGGLGEQTFGRGFAHVRDDWSVWTRQVPDTEWLFFYQYELERARRVLRDRVAEQVTDEGGGCGYHGIFVAGFSNGGHTAIQFARQLQDKDGNQVKIDSMFIVDAVPKFINPFAKLSKPGNADRLVSISQSYGGIRGHHIDGAVTPPSRVFNWPAEVPRDKDWITDADIQRIQDPDARWVFESHVRGSTTTGAHVAVALMSATKKKYIEELTEHVKPLRESYR